jgi:hypothetical protein
MLETPNIDMDVDAARVDARATSNPGVSWAMAFPRNQ